MGKTLVSDFDGTLIKCTLEVEFIKFLFHAKKFKFFHYILFPLIVFINLIPLHLFKTGTWFKTWTLLFSDEELNKLFDQFFDSFKKKDIVNYKVLEIVKNFKGSRILLTGCYEPLANFYLEKSNIYSIFDKVIGCRVGKFNFFVNQHPYGKDKVKFLSDKVCAVGLGDSYVDNYFLSLCDKVYIVGGSQRLIKYAKKDEWDYKVINS